MNVETTTQSIWTHVLNPAVLPKFTNPWICLSGLRARVNKRCDTDGAANGATTVASLDDPLSQPGQEAKAVRLLCCGSAFNRRTLRLRSIHQDRAGRATLETARTFNASSNFFDILEQFGDLGLRQAVLILLCLVCYVELQIIEKRPKSKLKAINIARALKEGRVPAVGNPLEEQQAASLVVIPKVYQPQVSDLTTLPPLLDGVPLLPVDSVPVIRSLSIVYPSNRLLSPSSPFFRRCAGLCARSRLSSEQLSGPSDWLSPGAEARWTPLPPLQQICARPLLLASSRDAPTARPGAIVNAADRRAKDFVEFCTYAVAAFKAIFDATTNVMSHLSCAAMCADRRD
ncbi:unnamed protein product [Sphagnum jensenii]|uniref:Vta1/callose synthase N-terminal domain-containing protein n=1 Tax=Sphagnum jensenii TaxID=128206 RepID=A0ABP0VJD8_9BRYO